MKRLSFLTLNPSTLKSLGFMGIGLFIAINYNACGDKFKAFETQSDEAVRASTANQCPKIKPHTLQKNKLKEISFQAKHFNFEKKIILNHNSLITSSSNNSAQGQQKISDTRTQLQIPEGKKLVALIDNNCVQKNSATPLSHHIIQNNITARKGVDAYLFTLKQNENLDQLHQQAIEDPCLIGISENQKYKTMGLLQDPNNYLQTHLPAIGADKAYDLLYPKDTPQKTNEIVVAVIDTGVDYTHPDLRDNMWKKGDEQFGFNITKEGREGEFDPMENSPISHGTHVAGIIAAHSDNNVGVSGVSPYQTKIMAVNVFYDDESSDTLLVVKGMLKALDNGADVVNLSLGKYGSDQEDTLYLETVEHLTNQGVVVISVTGNASKEFPQSELTENDFTVLPAKYGTRTPGMITVASVDINTENLSSFSHYSSKYAEIAAFGNTAGDGSFGIYSTVSYDKSGAYYGRLAGTSMAGPQVSAAAAIALAYFENQNQKATPELIEQLILNSASRHDKLQEKVAEGRILDLHNLSILLKKCY